MRPVEYSRHPPTEEFVPQSLYSPEYSPFRIQAQGYQSQVRIKASGDASKNCFPGKLNDIFRGVLRTTHKDNATRVVKVHCLNYLLTEPTRSLVTTFDAPMLIMYKRDALK